MTRKGLTEFFRLIRYRLIERAYSEAMPVRDIASLTGYSPESVPVLANRLSLPPHPNQGGKKRKARTNYVCKAPRSSQKDASDISTEPAPITLAGPEWSRRSA